MPLFRLNRAVLTFLFILVSFKGYGQFTFGTTGLLNLPSGDMQKDKTVMLGGSLLNRHSTPATWYYNTYNYYLNVTIFPWMEASYTCTLFTAKALGVDMYPETRGHFSNQDRNFSFRFRLWKEGWWKPWTPQIVLGFNDALHTFGGDVGITKGGNGHWGRAYLAVTKHFAFENVGELGAHVVGMYNNKEEFRYDGVGAGVNFQFKTKGTDFGHKMLNGLDLIAEYDTRSFNTGIHYAIWKDFFNITAELNNFEHFSCGAYIKIHLK